MGDGDGRGVRLSVELLRRGHHGALSGGRGVLGVRRIVRRALVRRLDHHVRMTGTVELVRGRQARRLLHLGERSHAWDGANALQLGADEGRGPRIASNRPGGGHNGHAVGSIRHAACLPQALHLPCVLGLHGREVCGGVQLRVRPGRGSRGRTTFALRGRPRRRGSGRDARACHSRRSALFGNA